MHRDVGETIKRFCNCLEREAKKTEQLLYEKGIDITRSQGAVMGYIYGKTCEKDNVYQKDIEKFFGLRRPSATNLLNRLESKNYIIRVKDELDARSKKLELTQKGLGFVDAIKENIECIEKKVIEGVTAQEMETFYSVIEKMTKNLSENK